MAQQVVGIGSTANDNTGDPLRTAFTKLNANDTELYARTAGLSAPTYGPTITIDTSVGSFFNVVATNNTAFTISAPLSPVAGRQITIRIKNTSGGALGVITWDASFKMPAFTNPATGNSRSVIFQHDGTNWVAVVGSAADVPN